MKTKLSVYAAFTFKALLILFCYIVGFGSLTKCDAQSIVGKWNQISSKQFFTSEGAKTFGKSEAETQTATIGSVVIDFKSDHTYVMKSISKYASKGNTFTGTWSLTGNQLQMKLDAKQEDPKYNPKKDATSPGTTLSINGNTMILNTLYADNKTINKIELTLKRM
jgi:Lipocalin-like domain